MSEAGQTDTDVLIVGAGPTGLMLANQLGRRGVRATIIDRHAGPALQTRALGVQARPLEIYAKLGIVHRALELGKHGTGANIWAEGRKTARVPLGEAGQGVTPYPYIFILGQDDNERIMGEKLRDWNMSVQWNTELVALEQAADRVTRDAQASGSHDAHVHRSLGRRLRRGAERGARVKRHYVSGRALRTRVFCCRHGSDGKHGAGRSERLLVVRRVPSVLPHAWEGPLADRRHRAAGVAGKSPCELRGRASFGARRSGVRAVLQSVHVVFDLPHTPSQRLALSRPPLLPGARDLGDLLQIHEIPSHPQNSVELARARIPQTSCYLVRPDGHIGLCGVRLEAGTVRSYFKNAIRTPCAPCGSARN